VASRSAGVCGLLWNPWHSPTNAAAVQSCGCGLAYGVTCTLAAPRIDASLHPCTTATSRSFLFPPGIQLQHHPRRVTASRFGAAFSDPAQIYAQLRVMQVFAGVSPRETLECNPVSVIANQTSVFCDSGAGSIFTAIETFDPCIGAGAARQRNRRFRLATASANRTPRAARELPTNSVRPSTTIWGV